MFAVSHHNLIIPSYLKAASTLSAAVNGAVGRGLAADRLQEREAAALAIGAGVHGRLGRQQTALKAPIYVVFAA